MNHAAHLAVLSAAWAATAQGGLRHLAPVQPDTFAPANALSSAFADVDDDGDLDLVVSFTDGVVLQVRVLDREGRATQAGAEVTFLTREGRVRKLLEGVDPDAWTGMALVVRAD